MKPVLKAPGTKRSKLKYDVEPMKPVLKAPGTKRSKLKHDEPLSSFSFNFNLRRYTWA
jgi:hypothetical protein